MHIYHKRVRGAKSGELKGTNLRQSKFCVHAIGQIQDLVPLIQSIILLIQAVILIQDRFDVVHFDLPHFPLWLIKSDDADIRYRQQF